MLLLADRSSADELAVSAELLSWAQEQLQASLTQSLASAAAPAGQLSHEELVQRIMVAMVPAGEDIIGVADSDDHKER